MKIYLINRLDFLTSIRQSKSILSFLSFLVDDYMLVDINGGIDFGPNVTIPTNIIEEIDGKKYIRCRVLIVITSDKRIVKRIGNMNFYNLLKKKSNDSLIDLSISEDHLVNDIGKSDKVKQIINISSTSISNDIYDIIIYNLVCRYGNIGTLWFDKSPKTLLMKNK